MQWRQTIGKFVRREFGIWRVAALPGLIVVALVVVARLTGTLQRAEWFALDTLLRMRPAEITDERILIVGIGEEDLHQIRTYPVPDRQIAALIEKLQQHQPAVIGLDIFRDLPIEPGHADLVNVFQSSPNLLGIEKVVPDPSTVAPPPALPPDQVGFADAIVDSDGFLRRSLLGSSTQTGQYKLSFTLQLAERYLSKRQFQLENGLRDPIAFRFGTTELSRFFPDDGGYVHADAGGNQVLIHFRSGHQPFQIVSLQEVMQGKVADHLIRDRIVLIGITANSIKDVVNVAGVQGKDARLVNGVEVQAHAVSQIVSAVLDKRPLLHVWAEGWELVWIVLWGLVGISLGRMIRLPLKLLLGVGISCTVLIGACYGLLLLGWWVPLVPAFLSLSLTGAGLTTLSFYKHQQDLETKLHDRQLVIDQTFDAIHNGPLQTLAGILRQVREEEIINEPLYNDLKDLNQELRAVYESMRQEILVQSDQFFLDRSLKLDLNQPLHELLYEVYVYTLSRDFPCFKTLKIKITTFEPIDEQFLTANQKRSLCRFLEEALCNVGKYAVGVTRLDVTCKSEAGQNIIRVSNNGTAEKAGKDDRSAQAAQTDNQPNDRMTHRAGGQGTQQAETLARQLRGQFQRSFNPPRGVICELVWSARKPWFWSRVLHKTAMLQSNSGR